MQTPHQLDGDQQKGLYEVCIVDDILRGVRRTLLLQQHTLQDPTEQVRVSKLCHTLKAGQLFYF